MTSIIKTKNLSTGYKNGTSLSFKDIDIKKGQSVLLLGSSGSGKTTLLSLMAGFLEPKTGQVFHDEDDFYKLSPQIRDKRRGNHFGFIFQTLHLIPYLNVYNNIALAAKMIDKPVDNYRIQSLIESLGIAHKLKSMPHELSQGERQRVAISRAVLNCPSIIIADEPTSALDDGNARLIVDLIKNNVGQKNSTLIFATHDKRIIDEFDVVLHLDQSCKASV